MSNALQNIVIFNQKVPVVKMISLREAAEWRGRGAMVIPPPRNKSLIVQAISLIQSDFYSGGGGEGDHLPDILLMNGTVYNSK